MGAALALLTALSAATATTRLPAGTVIEPAHVASCAEPCALVGRQLDRTVYAGRPLTLADTRAPDALRRNDRVTLLFRHGPLTLEAKGRSLGAGPVGAVIDVMNEESRRVVAARIVGPGLVAVGP